MNFIMYKEEGEDQLIEEMISTSQPKKHSSENKPRHDPRNNRVTYYLDKLKFYYDNREFETMVLFLDENFPNFLKANIEIHYTLLLLQLIEMIIKEEDFHVIEKYFQIKLQELINISISFKQKTDNVRMLIDNSFCFRNNDFRKIVENYLEYFFDSLRVVLQQYELSSEIEEPFICNLDVNLCREIKARNMASLHNIETENDVVMKTEPLANFLNFISQENKSQNVFELIAPHYDSQKNDCNMKKKENGVGNKINFVIEDLLESKANSSTMTESTHLTHKEKHFEIPEKKKFCHENTFLKEFTQKFIKREAIDKKILRAFRKYLKRESSKIFKKVQNKKFWIIFIKDNILPPMKLFNSDLKINVEFKSFSVKYMNWLFSNQDAKDLYKEFVAKNGEKVYNSLTESVSPDPNNDKDYSKFCQNLYNYIFNLTKIYSLPEYSCDSAPVTPVCPIPPTQNIIIDSLYGPDLKPKEDNFLNLYRNRSRNKLDESFVNDEEEVLLNDLFFQNSYGELNLSKEESNEVLQEHFLSEDLILSIGCEKLSSMPEFEGLIEIEKDPISASFISNIEIQMKSNYSPNKIMGYLSQLENDIKKQYDANMNSIENSKVDYEASLGRIDNNLESQRNRISELEETTDYYDKSATIFTSVSDINKKFDEELKDVSSKENDLDHLMRFEDSKDKILKEIDIFLTNLKTHPNSTNIEVEHLKNDFENVGSLKEFYLLSNLKNWAKVKLSNFLYDIKSKLLNKFSSNGRLNFISNKQFISEKLSSLKNITLDLIRSTDKMLLINNNNNKSMKNELRAKREFEKQMNDEKSKLKELYIAETTNSQSVTNNMLKALNGIKKVREYFIKNYLKLKKIMKQRIN